MSLSNPDQSPLSSPAQDLRKLKANGAATAQELTEWLARMRGKSPREVLGAVANSNLIQSFAQASIGVAVFVLVFTVIPWTVSLIKGDGASESTNTEEVAKAGAEEGTETPVDETNTTPKDPEDPVGTPDIDINDKAGIANKLGVGETKEAPANVNPLDGSVDDLLEGLE